MGSRWTKWILALMLLIIVGLGTVTYLHIRQAATVTQSEAWKSNWGVDIPEAVRSQQVLYFPGRDYTKFSIHEYDESTMEKLIEVPEWRMIGITHGFLMNRIDEFKADLLRWYPDQSDKINEAFAEHMPVFQEHDYYFLMNKKDRSYFIAILNLEQWKLYAIEVYF